jgi:signal transduction histidine kinase
VWFREIVSVERGPAGNLAKLRGVMVDITEQKRAEEERTALEHQLRQAQKMEAIGRLAGGIAHDFNNLLTAILGYAELASSRLDRGGADVRTELGEIRASSERAASLTQQLLAFSRQQVMQPQVLDLNVVLGEFARLLRRLVGEEIELVTETADEPLFVEADAAQLEQVLMNLAINARDAMPDGGTLTISTAACEVDEAAARASDDARPGTFAVVSVTDTGSGIDAETRRRLFEPFFTTKELGRGTGLGLATVYGIVQQSNGFLTVDSEPGQGSTFRVFLPLSEEPRPGRRDGAGTAAPRGTERILLVEDDPVVCDLTRRVLELQGYEVLVAADPLDALACAEEYDLLLTDVVMPRMRGGELARRVRSERRGLKVLFMSGHVDGESLAGDGTEGATAFIQKPFALDDLARAVRALLDS